MKRFTQIRMQLLLALLVFSLGTFAQNVVPDEGNGGPVLLVTSSANPFSKFPVEILRAEGWNAYKSIDISAVTATELNKYDVVIIGDIPVTPTQAALFDSWTTINGGTLIAFSPDPNLYSLLGITAAPGTLADRYMQINNSSAPGAGLVSQTIQYHGSADLFTLNPGTVAIATIYSDANTPTTYPAVTLRNVTNGGQAIAFTYDLARSIVYTRQGNPAWSGQERDGENPIRSDDLFYGASATDPQPDYVDFNKIAIPQADEQMRLLSNLMLMGSYDKKPLPRVWFLPKGKKAVVVMTGDDHGNGGTVQRFDQYQTFGPNTQADVDNWDAIRGSSYIFNGSITDAQVINYQNLGFEIGLHLNVNEGSNFTDAQWNNYWDAQMLQLKTTLPHMANQVSHRTHFVSWGSWAQTAKLEVAKGVRMDVNYYYYPATWVAGRAGMFTGSGMPMRFADLDGTLINNYQVTTQLPDESVLNVSSQITTLLDNAIGSLGYYGVFCANMHTDNNAPTDNSQIGSDAIIAAAKARNISVISAKQMLDWIDGRNNAYFSNIVWNNSQLAFTLTADSRARNMKLMLPGNTGLNTFQGITKNGLAVPFTMQIIKGVQYAFFDGTSGDYVAIYSATGPDITPPAISNVQASTNSQGSATITWTTDEISDSRIDYGTNATTLSSNLSDVTLTTSHSFTITGLSPLITYYFRVTSKDIAGNISTEPVSPAVPLQFTMPPSTVCASDNLSAEFALGTPDANISITTIVDGELSLKQALTEEQFTATSQPAGWNSGPAWNTGGTVDFTGGFANVQGSKLYTTATSQPGATVEFSARFSLGDFENIGLSQDNNFGGYWITVGRGGAGSATDVYVRTSDGILVSLGTNLINAFHTYRITWGVSNFTVYVDDVLKATVNKTFSTPMIFIVSDYFADANDISVDFYRNSIGGYAASGTYISRVFALGSIPSTTSILWNESVPANTGLSISVRSGNSNTPDVTWSPFATVSNNQAISLSGTNVQYQAILTTSNSTNTPLLNDITFNCTNTQTQVPPVISNVQSAPALNGTSVITWTTDIASDSRIDFGTSAASLSSTSNDATLVTSHSITLTGLTLGTTYYYTVTSKYGTSLPTTSPAAPAAPLQFTMPVIPPPVISAVQAAPSVNGTSVITWTTDVTSDSRIDYGTSSGSLSNVVNDAAQVTSHSITLTGLTLGTTYYYTVTSKNGTSLPATFPAAPASPLQFTMPVIPPAVTLQPSNAVTCLNGVITMTSAASGTPLPTVQWQVSTNGTTWTNITGATNSTLTFTPVLADNGKRYRANWTNIGGTVNSNSALLTVNPLPNGSLTSGTACYGQPAQLTFTATGNGTAPYSLVVNGVTYNNVQSGTPFVTTTTATPPANIQTQLWANTVVPGTPTFTETNTIEAGTKVRVTVAGTVSALRFYKGNRTAPETYRLRLYNNATQRIMAEVTYANSNYQGWVTVNLPVPVALATDSLYVVTYFSTNRITARQNNVFNNNLTRTPLIGVGTGTIYGPNGVYVYGGGFPTVSAAGRSYFADLVFVSTPAATPIAFNLTRITDSKGCVRTVNQTRNVTPTTCTIPALSKSSTMDNTTKRQVLSMPESFILEQNRPNPFNNTTIISYTVPKQVRVTLTIYDLQGRIIKVIDEGQRSAGKYMLNIDSKNMNKGIYMYRLQAGEFSATKKMILE